MSDQAGGRGAGGQRNSGESTEGVRLQKVLAQAGFGSRRKCEELIAYGHVEVDGRLVTELGSRVDPTKAQITVDGMRVSLDDSQVVVALNKPLGVVSAMSDPQGRPTLEEFVADRPERLFHVGRLDYDSQGLIFLTNDGELANRLSHPKYKIPKTYVVTVEGELYPRRQKALLEGVELEDGVAKADRIKLIQTNGEQSIAEIQIHDGRNRIVRRMFDAIDCPVIELVRTKYGPIKLGELKSGRTRVLGNVEVGSLMNAVGL
ncbi:MAG: rRNA pseudouridine synthase [Cellulomonadaceae bacterium]|jgi:23S rRNA pseudouridine2605 synthase|nr:rRNA pseudouridine synthase [Cellulomonadaceae bacterium]